MTPETGLLRVNIEDVSLHEAKHHHHHHLSVTFFFFTKPRGCRNQRADEKNGIQELRKEHRKSKYLVAVYTAAGIIGAIALAGFIISGGMLQTQIVEFNLPWPQDLP